MGMAEKLVSLFGARTAEPDALTTTEIARQRVYLIRGHYANPDHSDMGDTTCPLYYASLQGLGGDDSDNIANTKGLPRKNPPADYRMISPFNYVPDMIERDISCMMNGFSLERLKILFDGEEDQEAAEFCRAVIRENASSENGRLFSIRRFLLRAAGRGDDYIRVKPWPDFETGVRLDSVFAEAMFPIFAIWNTGVPIAYRTIFKIEQAKESAIQPEIMETGEYQTYVERVDVEGVTTFIDGKVVNSDDAGHSLTGTHAPGVDEIPCVHFAYRDSGEFFGIPCADGDLVSAMDDANLQASHVNFVNLTTFGLPNLFLYGARLETSEFKWGARGVHTLAADAKADLLHFEGLEELIMNVKQRADAVRKRCPQFVIDDTRMTAETGVALAYRLFTYDSYLAQLESTATEALEDLCRLILKTAGQFKAGASFKVELDWGPRFPVDIQARLEQAKTRVALFGMIKEVIAREARAEGYTDEEIAAILAHTERMSQAQVMEREVAAAGGGMIGAQMAAEMRRKQIQSDAASPPGKVAIPPKV